MADFGDDFPAIRELIRQQRARNYVEPEPAPVPTTNDLLAELTKQVRLSNLIQWAAITNNTKAHAAEILEGLGT
jgi:phosphoglycolate phosphatase-like HAD superfamily hydrolase